MSTTSIVTHATTTHRDFTPIIKLIDGDLVASVPADSPIRTVKDLVEGLRKDVDEAVCRCEQLDHRAGWLPPAADRAR